MNLKIFLDIDGVLADFHEAANTFYQVDIPREEITEWELNYERYNKTRNSFWNELTEDFWRNIPKLPWCDEIINFFCFENDFNVCLLTAPAYKSATGKQRWIRKNLPDFYNNKRYLIGPAKRFCASSDSILIDDREQNCKAFINGGGRAIVFPAPWNSWRNVKNPVRTMKSKFKGIMIDFEIEFQPEYHGKAVNL